MTARRNKLVGQCAAEKMKLTAEETDASARAVVHADFEEAGDDDVVSKLVGDLTAAGIETADAAVRTVSEEKWVEARSEERRIGTECVGPWRLRGLPAHYKKTKKEN